MPLGSIAWIHQWGGQLAELASEIGQKIPEGEEWETLRNFLQNVQQKYRRGDIKAGVRAVYQIMPFIQRAISSTEKVLNVDHTYKVTETITAHFLVDEEARQEMEEYMAVVRKSVATAKRRVEDLVQRLDLILDDVLLEGRELPVMTVPKIAFEMNSTEEQLLQVRALLDALDSHVTAKHSLANLLSYIAFILAIVHTSSGNLPLSAACFTAATASRKSAQALQDYRKQLATIDKEHRHFQTEVKAWRHHFRAEQINFLLLVGVKKILILLFLIVTVFFLIGKAGNFLVFALVILLLLWRAEDTGDSRYYIVMAVGVLAVAMEIQHYQGLLVFNTITGALTILAATGFL